MKLVEPALYHLLKDLAGGKVYGMRAPDGAAGPFVIFQRSDGRDDFRSINGASGLPQVFFQVDAYAPDLYSMRRLAVQVKTVLDSFRGNVHHDPIEDADGGSQTDVFIAGISYQSDTDLLDETDAPLLFRNRAEYLVTYRE